MQEVENGNAITEKTVEALNQILEMMNQFAEAAKETSDTSRKQAEMLNQVELGIEQISTVVQNNSASAEETSATSEQLSAQSGRNLRDLSSRFQLMISEKSDLRTRKVLYRDKQDIENSEEKTDKLNEMRTDTYIFMYSRFLFSCKKRKCA